MSVYKEGFFALAELVPQQKQVYNFACDYGVPMFKDDKNWNLVKMLVEFYGDDDSRKIIRYDVGTTVSININLMDEWQTGDDYTYELTYVTTRGGGADAGQDGYCYIERLATKNVYPLHCDELEANDELIHSFSRRLNRNSIEG